MSLRAAFVLVAAAFFGLFGTPSMGAVTDPHAKRCGLKGPDTNGLVESRRERVRRVLFSRDFLGRNLRARSDRSSTRLAGNRNLRVVPDRTGSRFRLNERRAPRDPETGEIDYNVPARARNLISGGQPTTPCEWPWQVSILHWKEMRDQFYVSWRWSYHCGGSLLDERHILTAAHCVNTDELYEADGKDSNGFSTGDLAVGVGIHDVSSIKSWEKERMQTRIIKVEKITMHPRYIPFGASVVGITRRASGKRSLLEKNPFRSGGRRLPESSIAPDSPDHGSYYDYAILTLVEPTVVPGEFGANGPEKLYDLKGKLDEVKKVYGPEPVAGSLNLVREMNREKCPDLPKENTGSARNMDGRTVQRDDVVEASVPQTTTDTIAAYVCLPPEPLPGEFIKRKYLSPGSKDFIDYIITYGEKLFSEGTGSGNSEDSRPVVQGVHCVSTGWGIMGDKAGDTDPAHNKDGEENQPAKILQETKIDVLEWCSSDWVFDINSAEGGYPAALCGRGVNLASNEQIGSSTCSGDSGGPLVCRENGSSIWYLYGVVSTGRSVSAVVLDECLTNTDLETWYADTFYVRNWIHETMGLTPPPQYTLDKGSGGGTNSSLSGSGWVSASESRIAAEERGRLDDSYMTTKFGASWKDRNTMRVVVIVIMSILGLITLKAFWEVFGQPVYNKCKGRSSGGTNRIVQSPQGNRIHALTQDQRGGLLNGGQSEGLNGNPQVIIVGGQPGGNQAASFQNQQFAQNLAAGFATSSAQVFRMGGSSGPGYSEFQDGTNQDPSIIPTAGGGGPTPTQYGANHAPFTAEEQEIIRAGVPVEEVLANRRRA